MRVKNASEKGLLKRLDMIRTDLRQGNLTVTEYLESLAEIFGGSVMKARGLDEQQ